MDTSQVQGGAISAEWTKKQGLSCILTNKPSVLRNTEQVSSLDLT